MEISKKGTLYKFRFQKQLGVLLGEVEAMVRKKKVMSAIEMEQWLLSKGAVLVTEEMKKKPWYGKAIALPACFNEVELTPKREDHGN